MKVQRTETLPRGSAVGSVNAGRSPGATEFHSRNNTAIKKNSQKLSDSKIKLLASGAEHAQDAAAVRYLQTKVTLGIPEALKGKKTKTFDSDEISEEMESAAMKSMAGPSPNVNLKPKLTINTATKKKMKLKKRSGR